MLDHVLELSGVLLFGCGISKVCETIAQTFHKWKFGLSGTSRGKEKKNPQKSVSSITSVCFFSGIAHCN